MANNKKYEDVLGEGKIGTYQEAAGGGTGSNKNFHVAKTQEEADQYKKANPGAEVRVNQPRDGDGQFTYNSANRKTLKYGPSRGETIPPFLKGVRMTYAQKANKGDRILSSDQGKKHVYINDLDFTREDMVQAFKEYKEGGLGFGDFSKEIQRKRGRLSKKEKLTKTVSIIDPKVHNQQMQTTYQYWKQNHQKPTVYARAKANAQARAASQAQAQQAAAAQQQPQSQTQTQQAQQAAASQAQPIPTQPTHMPPPASQGNKTMQQSAFLSRNKPQQNANTNLADLSDLFGDSSTTTQQTQNQDTQKSLPDLGDNIAASWLNRNKK